MKYRVTRSIVYEVEGYDVDADHSYGPRTRGEAVDLVNDDGTSHPAVREVRTQWEVQQILPPDPRAG